MNISRFYIVDNYMTSNWVPVEKGVRVVFQENNFNSLGQGHTYTNFSAVPDRKLSKVWSWSLWIVTGNSSLKTIFVNHYFITTTIRYWSESVQNHPFPSEFVPINPFSILFFSDLHRSHSSKPECVPTASWFCQI